jgi:hypothetical protein
VHFGNDFRARLRVEKISDQEQLEACAQFRIHYHLVLTVRSLPEEVRAVAVKIITENMKSG